MVPALGGLFAARTLANQPVDVLLVDGRNLHVFTPLITLPGFPNQLNVPVNRTWNYVTYDRSVRIILEHEVKKERGSTDA